MGASKPSGGGKGGKGGPKLESWMADKISKLCDRYSIDERLQGRLSEAMAPREKTFDDDIRTLEDTLATARNPPGLLSVKIREMQDGTFQAKGGGRGRQSPEKDRRKDSRKRGRDSRSRSRSRSNKRRRKDSSRSKSRSRSRKRGKDKDRSRSRS